MHALRLWLLGCALLQLATATHELAVLDAQSVAADAWQYLAALLL
jgi:hypothetical protein